MSEWKPIETAPNSFTQQAQCYNITLHHSEADYAQVRKEEGRAEVAMATRGRPTDYRPEYCDAVVECMKQGFSLTAFAGEIGVARSTINEWINKYPDFSVATKKGQAARVRCLEQTLLAGETGPRVTGHIFALKNADPDEWRDKVQQEHTGPNGGPMVTRVELVPLMPDDDGKG